MKTKIMYLEGDLPKGAKFSDQVAVDTETTGLSLIRDRLCVVQVADGRGNIYVVRITPPYDSPNLRAVLSNARLGHIFHYARFDMAMIKKHMRIAVPNVFCTKIASRLVRTSAPSHSLKAVVREFFSVDLDKDEQTSDWAASPLSEAQVEYAAGDVLYLHRMRDILVERLKREKRLVLAEKCFSFLPARVELDLSGWGETDIFAH